MAAKRPVAGKSMSALLGMMGGGAKPVARKKAAPRKVTKKAVARKPMPPMGGGGMPPMGGGGMPPMGMM